MGKLVIHFKFHFIFPKGKLFRNWYDRKAIGTILLKPRSNSVHTVLSHAEYFMPVTDPDDRETYATANPFEKGHDYPFTERGNEVDVC